MLLTNFFINPIQNFVKELVVCAAYLFMLELSWQWLKEIAIFTLIIAIAIAAVVLMIYNGKVRSLQL